MFRAALIALLLLIPVTASGQTCPQFEATLIAGTSQGFTATRMKPADRVLFLDAFNRVPPVSDAQPDQVWLFVNPSRPQVSVIVFVEGGCVTTEFPVPSEFIQTALTGKPS